MKKALLLGLVLACIVASYAQAKPKRNHMFISGKFKNAQEVTKVCLGCHDRETKQFMKTVHWTWTKKQNLNGKTVDYGKRNALSNACGMLPSNWQGCTNCHAGYGWADASFDFSKPENIDCLICHETTGTYKKFPGAAGHPVYPGETREYPKGTVWPPVDLAAVARSVERPTRAACGNCHFYGADGDGAKHGDLDSTLANPSPEIDVHMGKHKLNCESCHKAAGHDVRGESIAVSLSSGPRVMSCADCHKGRIHQAAALNMHITRIACQTCHIPFYAKGVPTLTRQDLSTAGKDLKPEEIKKDATGMPLYDKRKGDLTYGKNLVPTLVWYNGSIERVMMGDKIDPTKAVQLTAPRGERSDPNARIAPFKFLTAKQPYDKVNNTIAVVNMVGDSGTSYVGNWDWDDAIKAGMKAAGQPYSGKFGWVETSSAWSLNHMVAPKQSALSCPDCHVEGGRIDWKRLGYPSDPRDGH